MCASDIQDAEVQVLMAIQELRQATGRRDEDLKGWCLDVADASGLILLSIPLDALPQSQFLPLRRFCEIRGGYDFRREEAASIRGFVGQSKSAGDLRRSASSRSFPQGWLSRTRHSWGERVGPRPRPSRGSQACRREVQC